MHQETTSIVTSSKASTPYIWASAAVLAKIASVAVLILFIYGQSLRRLALDWSDEPGASFGLLIPPLALYIAWLLRKRTRATPVEEDNRGLLLVFAGCLLFLIGKLGAEFFITRVSFIIVLAGLTWTFWGVRRLRSLWFPFILLLTSIPLPALIYNRIAMPLQLLASILSTRLIQAFGGTVYRNGNIIELPGISLGIAEACSGLSSLNSLMVAALLVGFLQCRRTVTKVFLFLISIPLAIAVNVLRITGTALIVVHWEEAAMGFYHSFAGWLVFVVSFIMLILLSVFLRWCLD
jgi:exosortase